MVHPFACESHISFFMKCLLYSTVEVYHVICHIWLPLTEQMGLMALVIFLGLKDQAPHHGEQSKTSQGMKWKESSGRSATAAVRRERKKRKRKRERNDSISSSVPFPPQWPQGRSGTNKFFKKK